MAEPNIPELKERARVLWGMGDYPKIAAIINPAAQALLDACAISAGQEVLDVAAGSGNLAILAAEEGASVVASDISPGQVELGRARSEADGVSIEWHEADAEELPFEDGRFDCAASVFGAVFAPRPEVVASELFRVVKPGGTVGLTSWGPYGAQGAVFEVMGRYGPPQPEGVPLPREWGVEETARERLEPHASSLEFERRKLHWEFDSPDAAWNTFLSAGPGAAAAEMAPPDVLERVRGEIFEVLAEHDKGDGDKVVLEPEYLQIVARKRG
jgi:SAM-dependent methyltransferase